ncbi:unnamed protein product, partial [Dibothriocephalus latus]
MFNRLVFKPLLEILLNDSKPSTDVPNNVKAHDQPSKNAGSDDVAAASPPLIDDAKMHEMEAHLMKQLTSVMLTSPRNLSTLTPSKPPKKSKEDYKFWKTQPVPDLGEEITTNEPVEPDTPISEIRTEPYSLPKGFFWQDLDLNNPAQLQELYDLLNENYVEDDDHLFRFAYAKEFLKWTIQPPGWRPEWHVSVRVEKNSKLVGFIAGMPSDMDVHGTVKKMVEINFLCVHKRLRDKRMAPVLIREITRRVNLQGIFQAVYTSGTILPRPVATCRYWHRPLNPRKLLEVGFSHLSRAMTLQRSIKLYRLPDETDLPGFREMQEKDLPATHTVYCYVVVSPETGEVTDMCSFYSLPSSVMQNQKYSSLRAAYSFYNFSTKTPWTVLMKQALIKAKQ